MRSALPVGNKDAQPVKFVGHHDLARQAAAIVGVHGMIKNIFFHAMSLAHAVNPCAIDMDMAGGAGAAALAVGINPGNIKFDSRMHDRHARSDLRYMFGSVGLYKSDAGQFDVPFKRQPGYDHSWSGPIGRYFAGKARKDSL